MARPKTPSHPRFRFNVTAHKAGPELEDQVVLPRPLVAIGVGAICAVLGAAVVAALVIFGWADAAAVPLPAALTFIGQVWLLIHGVPMTVGSLQLSVVPLGLTLVQAVIVAVAAALVQRSTVHDERVAAHPVRTVVGTAAQIMVGYAVVAVIGSLALGEPATMPLPAAPVLAFCAALVGAGYRAGAIRRAPAWVRAAARGGAAGILALVGVAAIALALALLQGETRIAALEQSLGLSGNAGAALGGLDLAYLPTLLGWTSSWLFGAGFTLGDGTLVAPWVTRLGLLPSVPWFGALPAEGTSGLSAWMVAAMVPGVVAGVVAVRFRPARVVPALGAGLAAAATTALTYLALVLASRGAMGVSRFAEVGPRVPEVFIGAGIIVLTGALAALVGWFVDRRPGSEG